MNMRFWLLAGVALVALKVGMDLPDTIAFHPKPKRRRRVSEGTDQ